MPRHDSAPQTNITSPPVSIRTGALSSSSREGTDATDGTAGRTRTGRAALAGIADPAEVSQAGRRTAEKVARAPESTAHFSDRVT